MRKPWSISTTVRNPERLQPFLQVLAKLEGRPFDTVTQVEYQILLIEAKLYKPQNLKPEYRAYFESATDSIPYEKAREIFQSIGYEDPPMRGRQSVNPLNKFGFAIARAGSGPIKITDLGRKFIAGDYDIGFVFFKSLLKLQFPNPWNTDFSAEDGFNIMPFVVSLQLFHRLKERTNTSALTKEEFCIFIPTLIDANQVDSQIDEILAYRATTDRETFKRSFCSRFYGVGTVPPKKIGNLFDYGDNIMRCFRLTRYFRVSLDPTGTRWHIDLEPSRRVEIDQLLEMYDGTARPFDSQQQYLAYISDITQPALPWEELSKLRQVAISLHTTIKSLTESQRLSLETTGTSLLDQNLDQLSKSELESHVCRLRILNTHIRSQLRRNELRGDCSKLREIIAALRNTRALRKYEPEHFERLVADALQIINDEIQISPNCVTDDEGAPISHAPANKADIECFYVAFNATCEVTLDCSRLQWVHEGQPVMRHLRDFETKHQDREAFCLFIAPTIHNDTMSTFWTAVKYEYNGTPQRIIPLDAPLFAAVLETLLTVKEQNNMLSHMQIADLYKRIVNKCANLSGFSQWAAHIPDVLGEWRWSILNK